MTFACRPQGAVPDTRSGIQLYLLAPADSHGILPSDLDPFHNATHDGSRRRHLLDAMQRFRGNIAVQEGAISRERLTPDGRHEMRIDAHAWHLLLLRQDEIAGCMRYAAYDPSVRATDLLIWQCSLARSREWSFSLRAAVEKELSLARRRNFHFGEPGGWVIAPELRGSAEAIKLALGGFALARLLGGAVGVCTATRKNRSAAMLRRLGGRPLGFGEQTLPAYFEPNYGCEIEILRFDSDSISSYYDTPVNNLSLQLAMETPVLAAPAPARRVEAAR